jgi:transposase
MIHRCGMARAYSVDFRERLVDAEAAGASPVEIERLVHVSARSVSRWKRRLRLDGTLAPKPKPGRPRTITAADEAALREQVAAHRDATLAEHCAFWQSDHGITVSCPTMCRALQRLKLPLKKRV